MASKRARTKSDVSTQQGKVLHEPFSNLEWTKRTRGQESINFSPSFEKTGLDLLKMHQ
jgi:hypothetical protein